METCLLVDIHINLKLFFAADCAIEKVPQKKSCFNSKQTHYCKRSASVTESTLSVTECIGVLTELRFQSTTISRTFQVNRV